MGKTFTCVHSSSGIPVTPGQKGEQGAKLKFCLTPENSEVGKILRPSFTDAASLVYLQVFNYFEAGKQV